MKNLIMLFMLPALMLVTSCRTKKSTTDFKQTEIENVSVIDNSTVAQNETVQENQVISKTETTADKTFFEAWMSFESDKITITDNQGNKTEITNPRINKKQSRSNDVSKYNQIAIKKENVATSEENKQNDIAISNNRQKKTGLKTTDERKTKIVWLYVILGAVIVICFVYLINRYSKKSN